jgi:hypothetical protein
MRTHPIATPAWAVERANLVAAEMAEAITASGARVIGDLAHLLTPVPDDEPSEVPTSVDVQSAAEIAYAMFVAGRASARPRKRRPSPPEIDQLAGRDLVRALMGRVSARLRPGRDRPVRD